MNELKILVVEPNKLPYEKTIPNTLEAKQEIVGGLIECAYLSNDPEVVLICNEEAKLEDLPLNRDIGHDIIAGTFFIVGDDEIEDFKSLTEEQIAKYKEIFGSESINKTNLKVVNILMGKKNYDNDLNF